MKREVKVSLRQVYRVSAPPLPDGRPLREFAYLEFPCAGDGCAVEHLVSGHDDEGALWLHELFNNGIAQEARCRQCETEMLVVRDNQGMNRHARHARRAKVKRTVN